MSTHIEEADRIRQALEKLDPDYLKYLRKRVRYDESLWLLRGVLGEGLPNPMGFESLMNYARATGRGEFTAEDLESIFNAQMESV